MHRPQEATAGSGPLAATIILLLMSVTHLAYVPLAELQAMPVLPPALALSVALGAGYALAARRARRDRGLAVAVNLIVGEDLGVLAAGLILGHPWGAHLRPGTVLLLGLQLALAFAEIWRRQEARRPIVPAVRLAWFVVAYALAFAAYAALQPQGLWDPGDPLP